MKVLPQTVLIVTGICGYQMSWSQDSNEALQRAMSVLRTSPIVDTHNDLPWTIREKAQGDLSALELSVRRDLDTDIPRQKEGMVGTHFWSVWVPSALTSEEAMRAQLEQFDDGQERSDEDLGKLARENLLRVFSEVEQVAARARLSRPSSSATIEELDDQP